MYKIDHMSKRNAKEISKWSYLEEYSLYSFHHDEGAIRELLNGDYYCCTNLQQNLIGYFCYGNSARIPAVEEHIYTGHYLDFGLGLRPDLCGNGLGAKFVAAGMAYAHETFQTEQFRLVVAEFNQRAINVYKRLGFKEQRVITHRLSAQNFVVMIVASYNKSLL